VELVERLDHGTLDLLVEGRPCPGWDADEKRRCGLPVRLTSTLVERGVVWLIEGGSGFELRYESIGVHLARCPKGHRCRVLPMDILPRKVYSPAVQEALMAIYPGGELGLRQVVRRFSGVQVGYVSLWGWTAGLGCFVLGHNRREAASRFGAVVTETKKRCLPDLNQAYDRPVKVDRGRWKVRRRFWELRAVRKVLNVARAVARAAGSATLSPLAMWICLMFTFSTVVRISWWAGPAFTPIELGGVRSARVAYSASRRSEAPRCRTRTRSPPGATSR
jgi:hypothetical protein